MLGLSIDVQDELDDELLLESHGIRFIAEEGFTAQYGEKFAIFMQGGRPALSAGALPDSANDAAGVPPAPGACSF